MSQPYDQLFKLLIIGDSGNDLFDIFVSILYCFLDDLSTDVKCVKTAKSESVKMKMYNC